MPGAGTGAARAPLPPFPLRAPSCDILARRGSLRLAAGEGCAPSLLAVSTRVLIVAALLCGLAILLAFTVQVVLVAR